MIFRFRRLCHKLPSVFLLCCIHNGVFGFTTELPTLRTITTEPQITTDIYGVTGGSNSDTSSVQPISCPPGHIFCLQSGHCISIESCGQKEVSTTCPPDHVFCLQTGRCVPKQCEVTCDYGKYYCEDTKTCIPTWEQCSQQEHKCGEDEVFCLKTGMCIPKNSCDTTPPTTSYTEHCPNDHVYCLQTGRCIPKNCDATSPTLAVEHCPGDHMFCLQRGRCIPKSCDTTSPSPSPTSYTEHCPDDHVFCLQRGRCIPKSCDTTSPSPSTTSYTEHCPDDHVFCLQRGRCIPKSCDTTSPTPPTTSYTEHCPDDHMFCLQRGRCIPKSCDTTSPTPSPTSYTEHCPDDHVFCLQRGRCIPKSCNTISTPPTTSMEHCPDGHMFCLQRGRCIPKSCDTTSPTPQTTSYTEHCPDDHMFCLQRGRCIPKSCDTTSPTLSPTSYTEHCPDDHMFCLQRGRCIPKSCDTTSPTPPTTAVEHCPGDHMFCLQRGRCIPKSCDTTSPTPSTIAVEHCPGDHMFCLQRGKCIPKSCDTTSPTLSPTSYTEHCPDDHMFCLQRGRCIPKDSCDTTSPSPPTTSYTEHCPDGHMFCLQRGRCIPKSCDTTSPTPPTTTVEHCPDDHMFCLQRGKCIPKSCDTTSPTLSPTSYTEHCPDDHMFCLQRGRCIPKDSCDTTSPSPPTTSYTEHCPDGHMFCLQRGRCIPKTCDTTSPTPPTTSYTEHCPDDHMFCLQRGRCIPKSCDTTSPTPPTTAVEHCPGDHMFCLQRGKCIPKSCDTTSPTLSPTSYTEHCPDDHMFCLQRGRCIPKDSCDTTSPSPPTTSYTEHCPDGHMFCLQRGGCIPKTCDTTSPTPPTTSYTEHCPDDHMFCLQRGRCIPKSCDTTSPMPQTATSEHCPDDHMFCLQRGRCIPKSCDTTSPTPPTTTVEHCPDGHMFCLQTGRCIPKSCDTTSPTPPTTTSEHCPDGHMFCLQRGRCIPKSCDTTSPTPPTTSYTEHCPDDHMFCLQRGRCIPKSCDTTSPTPPATTVGHCPDGHMFCVQTGKCIQKSCDTTSPTPPTTSYTDHCPDDHMFCLQRGRCIPKSCDTTSPTPPTTTVEHCPDDHMFCLQRGRCIPKSCDTTSPTPPTTTVEHCPDGHMFCLQTGRCIPKSCDTTSTTPPTTTVEHCPDDHMFCLQTGKCIPKNSCGTILPTSTPTSPTTNTEKCPDDHVFCLQRKACIPKTCIVTSVVNETTVSMDDTTTPFDVFRQNDTFVCPSQYVFCLQFGKCVSQDIGCLTTDDTTHTYDNITVDTNGTTVDTNGTTVDTNDTAIATNGTTIYTSSTTGDTNDTFVFDNETTTAGFSNMTDVYPNVTTVDTSDTTVDTSETSVDTNDTSTPVYTSDIPVDTNGTAVNDTSTPMYVSDTSSPVYTSDASVDTNDTSTVYVSGTSTPVYTNEPSTHVNTRDTSTPVYTNDTLTSDGSPDFSDITVTPTINESDTESSPSTSAKVTSMIPTDTSTPMAMELTSTTLMETEANTTSPMTTEPTATVSMTTELTTTTSLTSEAASATLTTEPTATASVIIESTTTTEPVTTTPTTTEPATTTPMTTKPATTTTMTTEPATTTPMTTEPATTTTPMTTEPATTTPMTTEPTTQEAVSTTEGVPRDLLMLSSDLLTVDTSAEIGIDSLTAGVQAGVTMDISYPLNLICPSIQGITWNLRSGSGALTELTDVTSVSQTDLVVIATTGTTSGLVKCLIQTSGTSKDRYWLGILVVGSPITNVTMLVDRITVTEGTPYISMPNWTEIFRVDLPDVSPLDTYLEVITLDTSVLDTYRQIIQSYSGGLNTQANISPLPLDAYQQIGASLEIWSQALNSWVTSKAVYTTTGVPVDIMSSTVHQRLQLSSAYSGEFELVFTTLDGRAFTLTIEVVPVNDAPTFKTFGRRGVSEPIESVLLYPYSGALTPVTVADIVNAIYQDEEGDTLSLAFIGFTSTQIGTWEYFLNGNWETFPQISSLTAGDNVTVVLLGPTDTVRFQPTNGNDLWSQLDAQVNTQLYALASDGHNVGTIPGDKSYTLPVHRCGNEFCGTGGSSAFSWEIVPLYMSRAGCDDKPGSKLQDDRCGQCGGHDDCVDCMGVINGEAVIDQCNDCTGGTSGTAVNHNMDCGGSCEAENYIHSVLQICIPNNTNVQILYDALTGCDGVLYSDAYINSCGYCVLGTTTRAVDHGIDDCGVCNGNNTSCMDCNNVINGASVIDACGICLLPSDPRFDLECVEIVSITPSLVGASGVRQFEIKGANLSSYQSASCKFINGNNQEIVLTTTSFIRNENRIMVASPALSTSQASTYSVSCNFDQALTLTIADQSVTIYNYPVIDEIIPDHMTIKQEQKVIVRGSGILDTGYIQCAVRCPYTDPNIGCFSTELVLSGFILYPAKRLNDSAVECDLRRMSAVRKAMGYSVTVMVESFSDDNKNSLSYVEYRVIAPAPVVTQSFIHSRYCLMTVEFDMEVTMTGCINMLSSDSWDYISSLSAVKCILIGNRVIIRLYRTSTIQPGHTLFLMPNIIHQSGSTANFALYASGNFTMSEARVSSPKFAIFGPAVVGSCDPFTLTLTQKGVGCVELTYNWTVTANESNPSADVISDVEKLQSKLNNLQTSTKQIVIDGDEIVPGSAYNFTVTIESVRENKSYEASITVKRSVDVEPIQAQLKIYEDITKIDVNSVLRMRVITTLSKCANNTGGEIGYEWNAQTSDFSLSDFADNPFALVKSKTMRGGMSYTISVTAYFKDQALINSKSEVTIHTLSNPLVPRIRGGSQIKALSNEATLLDASLSYDPDRNVADTTYYVWSCEEESSGVTCVVIQNGGSVTLISLAVQTSSTSSLLTIPAHLMSPQKRYKWTVKMIKGDRSASYTTTVEVINNLPPVVDVDIISVTINPDEPLRVTSKVTSTGPVIMYWDCEADIDGYDFIELSDYLENTDLFLQKSAAVTDYQFSLYVPPSSLPSGANFVLRVMATHTENDRSAKGNIYVTVNSPPQIGDFSVSPINGTALITDFTLTLGDGWSDSENDVVAFFFFTRKTGYPWQQLNTRGLADILTYNFILPAGIHDVRVKACDALMACSMVDFTQLLDVAEKVLTSQDIDDTKETMDDLIQTGDMDKATGMAVSITDAIDDTSTIFSTLVNLFVKTLLYTLAPSYDPSETSDVLGTLNNIIWSLGSKGVLSLDVILAAQQNAFQLAILVTKGTGSSVSRKKRAVIDTGGSSSSSVAPMSAATATNTLTTYSTTFLSQNIGDITAQSASDYLTVLDNVMIGLCAEVTNVEPATVIQSQLTTVRVKKRLMDTIATEVIDVTCNDCPSYVAYPANVTYGSEIQSLYTYWNCSSGNTVQCYGGCLASAQMTTDLVTITTSTGYGDLVQRSNVIFLKLINPETYSFVDVPTLTTPIDVFVPISGAVNTSAYGFQCMMWVSSNWTNETCTSYGYSKNGANGSVYEVRCSCYDTGILSVFEGPVQEEMTTVADTTEATPTTTSGISTSSDTATTTASSIDLPSSTSKVYTKFTLTNDYDATLATFSSSSAMDDHFKQEIATDLNVTITRISEFSTKKGSIVVSFALLARSLSTQDTIGVVLARLQSQLQSGTLTITDQNGQVLTIDTASFQWSLTQFSDGEVLTTNHALIIVAAVGGVIALLILILFVIIIIFKKKKRNVKDSKVTPSPTPGFGKNMHGVDVPRPGNSSKGDGFTRGRIEVQPSNDFKSAGASAAMEKSLMASKLGDSISVSSLPDEGGSKGLFKPNVGNAGFDGSKNFSKNDVAIAISKEMEGGTRFERDNTASSVGTKFERDNTASSVGIGTSGGVSPSQIMEADVWIEKEIKMSASPDGNRSGSGGSSRPLITPSGSNLPAIG